VAAATTAAYAAVAALSASLTLRVLFYYSDNFFVFTSFSLRKNRQALSFETWHQVWVTVCFFFSDPFTFFRNYQSSFVTFSRTFSDTFKISD
jgi:uncharacterized protein (DUF58 family)